MVDKKESEYTEPTMDIVKQRLELLPGRIKQQEIDIMNTDEQIQNDGFRLKLMKNATLNEVAEEKDEDEKPKFKNQQQREYEAEQRLEKSPDYKEVAERLKKNNRLLKEQKIHFNFLERKFSSARNLAKIFGGGNNE